MKKGVKISLLLIFLFCFAVWSFSSFPIGSKFDIILSKTIGELNLVCQFDNDFEIDWLRELLDGVNINEISDNGAFQTMANNTIIVVGGLTNISPRRSKYFKKLKNMHFKFGVIHLSDEKYDYPKDYYNDAQFVFRNYWHFQFESNPKVTIFPLGYRVGFWADQGHNKQVKSCVERKYVWSFSGQLHRNRHDMLNHLKNISQHRIIETSGFARGLNITDYRNLLLDTIFVPCPAGTNIECFRVWEALECGCIPIVEKFPSDYYKSFLGNHPLLAVDSWEQAVDMIKDLMADQRGLEAVRLKCQTWWQEYKNKTKTQFANIIRNNLQV